MRTLVPSLFAVAFALLVGSCSSSDEDRFLTFSCADGRQVEWRVVSNADGSARAEWRTNDGFLADAPVNTPLDIWASWTVAFGDCEDGELSGEPSDP